MYIFIYFDSSKCGLTNDYLKMNGLASTINFDDIITEFAELKAHKTKY
jgi:hypothetical protein